MTPDQIEQVFGRGRLKMATGEHVEVFREAMAPGERRRYTKRFLATSDGDFGPWTEREWRILARLIGHGIRCVPDVVQFDGGAMGGARLVQTYDAGITVDQWGTLLPVARNGKLHRYVFEDCAHWWALAHHCLVALDEIHALGLVHLDIKGDNICIPYGPADFDPQAAVGRLNPEFARLALIDFAFSLVSRESLAMPLPIGWQKDYDYQSPRLLRALDAGRNGDLEPTRDLDWRCDLYSLAAMLKRYLPIDGRAHEHVAETGWTAQRYDEAKTLIFRLRDSHDRDLPHWRPHPQFIDYTWTRLEARDLAASLAAGWALARDTIATGIVTPLTPITPMTRIAPAIRTARRARTAMEAVPSTAVGEATRPAMSIALGPTQHAAPQMPAPTAITALIADAGVGAPRPEPRRTLQRPQRPAARRGLPAAIAVASLAAIAAPSFLGDPAHPLADRTRELIGALRPQVAPGASNADAQRTIPPVPPSGGEPETHRSVASRPEAEPARDIATATPLAPEHAAKDVPPTDAGASAPVSSMQPPAVVAAAQDEPHVAAAATKGSEERALPAANAARVPSESLTARAAGAPAASHAPGAKVAQARPKPGTATSRAQPAQRSTIAAAKPSGSTGTAKAYADATRRPAVHASPAEHARPPAPAARVDVASATPMPAKADSVTPPTPMAAQSRNESVPLHAGSQEAVASQASTAEPNHLASGAPPANAAAKPSASSGSELATSDASAAARSEPNLPPRTAPRAKPRDDWRTQLASLFSVFRDREGPPAPVEDRTAQRTNRQAGAARATVQPAADTPARVVPAPIAVASAPPAPVVPLPSAAPQPLVIESAAQSAAAPVLISPQVADARMQGGNVVANAAVASPPPGPPGMRSVPAPAASPPMRAVVAPRDYARDESRDFAAQARRLLEDTVPRVAAQAEPEVSRVLATAAVAQYPAQARLVVAAADGPWPSESEWITVAQTTPVYARQLHNEARRALASGGDVADALDLELRAFGANPRDPDIAGFLAFLYLRVNPARPEAARQLALHSIVQSGSRRSTRYVEWGTFAVASALTGRDADAVRGFLAEAALTTNVERSCQSALRAYATYGPRLRMPVMALLQRVNAQGRTYDAPSCMWPAYWSAGARAGSAY